MFQVTCRAAPAGAVRPHFTGRAPASLGGSGRAAFRAHCRVGFTLLAALAGCSEQRELPEVSLSTERLSEAEIAGRAEPALESGHPRITVRLVFTALGPCRDLTAEVVEPSAGQYVLQVIAHPPTRPCGSESPYIGYTAVLTGLPEGRSELRVVHITTDGRRTMQAVFDHPVLVTPGSVD